MWKLCLPLFIALAAPLAAEVTYANQVSRILNKRCNTCHRTGDIGPMSLTSYENAVAYAPDIQRVIEQGIMPPWKPTQGHGVFAGAFALLPEERTDLLSWIAADTPFGLEEDLPEAENESGPWALGEPDLTLQMPESFAPERGKDVYRCFVLPTGLDEDKFVTAIDVIPGNRRIVHHVILFLDSSGEAERLDAEDEAPGYDCYGGPGFDIGGANLTNLLLNGFTLGGWAPGARPQHLPEGIGMKLNANTRIVMQVHYYTGGRSGEDQTTIGLYFNREEIQKQLFFLPVAQTNLRIAAGNPAAVATAEFPVLPFFEMKAITVFPHMHLLGTKIHVNKLFRGERNELIGIENWDFNWQGSYQFLEPVSFPALSRVQLRCEYDNSVNNPRNPSNPLKEVRWGEGTEDEMCLVFLGVTFDRF
jgi:mono/diheme cytochrome c family protein